MNILQQFKQKAFTLIELLIVISLIAIISTIGLISMQAVRSSERDARRLGDIKTIRVALERYRGINSSFPDCITGAGKICDYDGENSAWFSCLETELKPFLGVIPKDPNNMFGGYCYVKEIGDSSEQISLQYFLESENSNSEIVGVKIYDEELKKDYFLYDLILQKYR